MALSHGVAAQEELDAVSAATADPSFSFLDALNVAAWGRVPCCAGQAKGQARTRRTFGPAPATRTGQNRYGGQDQAADEHG